MSRKIRWGILGCGNIANKFAEDLRWVEDAELLAVASRDEKKAIEFSARHKSKLAFGSYEELVSCPDVDAIYIATPHGLHREHALLCIAHKKAVLCEKAFALNSFDAKEMIEAARKNRVFIMEAFWTKFLPQYEKVISLIQSGEIGEIKIVQADFGFKASTPPNPTIVRTEFRGRCVARYWYLSGFFSHLVVGKAVGNIRHHEAFSFRCRSTNCHSAKVSVRRISKFKCNL